MVTAAGAVLVILVEVAVSGPAAVQAGAAGAAVVLSLIHLQRLSLKLQDQRATSRTLVM